MAVKNAFSGIKHVVPVQLDYHLAQPMNADEQSAYTTINHKGLDCKDDPKL